MNMSGWSSEAGNPNIQDLKGEERERRRERSPPSPPPPPGGAEEGEAKGKALRFKNGGVSEKMVCGATEDCAAV